MSISPQLANQEKLLMQTEAVINMIRESDPNALSLVIENREPYYIAKRIFDFTVALGMLVILSPLMIIIAISIVLYSPGPIFFVQERVGAKRKRCNGHTYWQKSKFRCYKFRTMRIDSDTSLHQAYMRALIEDDQEKMAELQGQETKIRKLIRDPRITRPGKLLRKFSLDELPQFWNVLRGDMSLVGPRPAIPYEVELYKTWYLRRLEAQPGITGLQQVTARSTIDFDRQMRLDIQYVENQSLWLDLKIMLKTPFVVISTKGAQ